MVKPEQSNPLVVFPPHLYGIPCEASDTPYETLLPVGAGTGFFASSFLGFAAGFAAGCVAAGAEGLVDATGVELLFDVLFDVLLELLFELLLELDEDEATFDDALLELAACD